MMQDRSALILKITPATNRGVSVLAASIQAASLDELLTENRFPASVVHEREQLGPVYRADDDGTFTVEVSDPESERNVTTFIAACGFTVSERYDAGWQTAEEMSADADVDAFIASRA